MGGRRIRKLGGLGALVLLVAACAGAPAPVASEEPVSGGRIVHGANEVATLQPILGVDPTSRLAASLVYAPPVVNDPVSGDVRPNLASWQVSGDGLSYTWTIVTGALWSDGTPITAADWLTGLKAVGKSRRTTYKSDFAEIDGFDEFAQGRSTDIRGVRLDPANPARWTVRFTRPYCPALSNRAAGYILPTHVFGKYVIESSTDEIDRAPENVAPPVASGPFRFSERRPGDQLVLSRNERYWKGPPLLEAYIFKTVLDGNSIALGLRSGDLNYANVPPADLDTFTSRRDLSVRTWSAVQYFYLGWNLRSRSAPALADRRVRQALAYGFDMDTFISTVLLGRATRIYSHHPPASWAYPSGPLETYRYDPAKAELLLREAGYERGADGIFTRGTTRLSFHILTPTVGGQLETLVQVAEQQFRRIGVEARPRFAQSGQMLDLLSTGSPDVEAWASGWMYSSSDPDPYIQWSADQIPDATSKRTGFNYGGYTRAEVQVALEQARTPSNGDCSRAARMRQYEIFNRLLNEDQPYLFGWAPNVTVVVSSKLRGFTPGPFGQHWSVERWWLAP